VLILRLRLPFTLNCESFTFDIEPDCLISPPRVRIYVHNRLKGRDSHWFGYLQSLPKEPVALALFWGVGVGITDTPRDVSEVNNQSATGGCFLDGQQAMTWITGTELEKELRGSAETGQTLLVSQDPLRHTPTVYIGLSRMFVITTSPSPSPSYYDYLVNRYH
jgi:hypothetical protein